MGVLEAVLHVSYLHVAPRAWHLSAMFSFMPVLISPWMLFPVNKWFLKSCAQWPFWLIWKWAWAINRPFWVVALMTDEKYEKYPRQNTFPKAWSTGIQGSGIWTVTGVCLISLEAYFTAENMDWIFESTR